MISKKFLVWKDSNNNKYYVVGATISRKKGGFSLKWCPDLFLTKKLGFKPFKQLNSVNALHILDKLPTEDYLKERNIYLFDMNSRLLFCENWYTFHKKPSVAKDVEKISSTISGIDEKVKNIISTYKLPNTEIIKTMVYMSLIRWQAYFENIDNFYITSQQIDFMKSVNKI